mgnify:CR=1 FL=1
MRCGEGTDMNPLLLQDIVADFAHGIVLADRARPVALNARSKEAFRAGIGPHSEAAAVRLVMQAVRADRPARYQDYSLAVPYPANRKNKCDLCIGVAPQWAWAIEAKLIWFFGDNGKRNDNILMHVLSPYAEHRSALTDFIKLRTSGFACRKAVLLYGFDHVGWSLDPAIEALETLAHSMAAVGGRCTAEFEGLVRPVHSSGRVFAWEVPV